MSELEEKLNLDLRVGTSTVKDAKAHDATMEDAELCPAGRVRNHLVGDRTIVVESGFGMVTFASGPLDEGSLLVVRNPDDSGAIVPLGRVFEVFGPVKQPLYTIRLLSPKDLVESTKRPKQEEPKSKDETREKSEGAVADADENAINVDEEGTASTRSTTEKEGNGNESENNGSARETNDATASEPKPEPESQSQSRTLTWKRTDRR